MKIIPNLMKLQNKNNLLCFQFDKICIIFAEWKVMSLFSISIGFGTCKRFIQFTVSKLAKFSASLTARKFFFSSENSKVF